MASSRSRDWAAAGTGHGGREGSRRRRAPGTDPGPVTPPWVGQARWAALRAAEPVAVPGALARAHTQWGLGPSDVATWGVPGLPWQRTDPARGPRVAGNGAPGRAGHLPLHVPVEELALGDVQTVPGHGQLQLVQVVLRLLAVALAGCGWSGQTGWGRGQRPSGGSSRRGYRNCAPVHAPWVTARGTERCRSPGSRCRWPGQKCQLARGSERPLPPWACASPTKSPLSREGETTHVQTERRIARPFHPGAVTQPSQGAKHDRSACCVADPSGHVRGTGHESVSPLTGSALSKQIRRDRK